TGVQTCALPISSQRQDGIVCPGKRQRRDAMKHRPISHPASRIPLLPFPGAHDTILPLARPLTTEDGVTGADAKAALERGRPVVLVCPPAPDQAHALWDLLGPTLGLGPGVGPHVLIVCADDAAAAGWTSLAPAGLRIHAVTGLAGSARRLKERPPQVLTGAVKDLAALVQRAVLKLD